MDPQQLAANRDNWDDRVAIHVASDFYDVEGWLAGDRHPRPWEAEAVGDVTGLDLIHLQCHFGLDTLSWAHVGANVTGVDFSGKAIAAATELAERAGLADRARFVEANVLLVSDALEGATFDLVYVSLGALCWLPSVDQWALQVANLLRPGGRLFFHDGHPLSWALADEGTYIENTYFEESTPFVTDTVVTYTDGETTLEHTRNYEWNHSVGEILNALLDNGLRIDRVTEHDWTAYPRYPWLVQVADQRWETPPGQTRIPLSLTVLASRPR
jgi:SAM-dependent methyltransferase